MTRQVKQFIGALTVCCAVFVGYWFWQGVVSDKIIALTDIEHQVNIRKQATSRSISGRTILEELADKESMIREYFIAENTTVPFIEDLEKNSSTQGASVSVVSVAKGGTNERPVFIFNLRIKGTFNAVVRTIGIIEYGAYDSRVPSLALAKDAEDAWHADLRLEVGAKAP